jgi:RNA polymerase sigma factor (sigma-70 family)
MHVNYVDELILAELRNKNDRVLSEVYKTHYPMIVKMIRQNSGDEDDAKDVYQEAILAFYQRVGEKDFVLTCRIATYLYAVSRRLWLKRLAMKRHVVMNVDEAERFLRIEEELKSIDDIDRRFEIMKQALEALGEPCSTIVRDFYIHDQSMEEIRRKFGYTNADNAKNQKYKCLQRLKKIFFDRYDVTKQ